MVDSLKRLCYNSDMKTKTKKILIALTVLFVAVLLLVGASLLIGFSVWLKPFNVVGLVIFGYGSGVILAFVGIGCLLSALDHDDYISNHSVTITIDLLREDACSTTCWWKSTETWEESKWD